MVEQNASAKWYLEINGQAEGPYSSQEIIQRVMSGSLKLETRIFDPSANEWKLAADVIPYLNLNGAAPASQPTPLESSSQPTGWQPPPKPTDLRDVHVVDLNGEATEGVDYFALISDRKKEVERARTTANKTQPSKEPQSRQPGSARFVQVQREEPQKIVRVAPPLEESAKSQKPALSLSNDGILSAEVESTGFLNVGKLLRFGRENKSMISIAAAMALVFTGTYGIVRTMSERKGREPAASNRKEPANTQVRPTPAQTTAANSAPSSDSLGSGRNRVQRQSGSFNNATPPPQYSRVTAPSMPAAPTDQNVERSANEPPREQAQYYSSGDPASLPPPMPPVADGGAAQDPNAIPAATPPNPMVNPDAPNPNDGLVQPPNFVPQANDQQADPNRAPTSDPSAPPANQ